MRVLVTHELFMPDFRGGGEKVVYEMVKGIKERGIEVDVLTTGNPNIKEFNGIKTKRLPINRYLMNLTALWICKHAKEYDLIQTCNYNACFPSWIAGKIVKKPVVCFVTGMYGDRWLKIRGPILGSISKWVEKFQLNHDFDKVVFPSEFARDCGVKSGIPYEITDVNNPGIELKNFKPKKKEWFVLFMGRFSKQKGVYDLIEVAEQLPDVKFKMVGSGEEEAKLKSAAPDNIEFLNLTFRSGKPFLDLYSRAAILCLPSIAESFGLVIPEAMASGCAIVSTVPLDYKGFTVKVNDIKQLKDSIKYLIDNPEKTLKMGRGNIKKAKKYTWGNFCKKMINIYEEVLNKR
jgi:glycosyltransferase involved in cell wall biosynthesis